MDSSGRYAQWRGFLLREERTQLSERLLQEIWYYQRLRRDSLHTVDQRPVRVLHPGFWNREAGPDFRSAVIQIGQEKAKTGDVEVDLNPAAWHSHGHDRNPNFKNVILHVVWESGPQLELPTLALARSLDAPLPELAEWMRAQPIDGLPAALAGQCQSPLRDLSDAQLSSLIQQAAMTRLEAKGRYFQARARQAGWEQALWEGTFRALGYKQNVWATQAIAERLPLLDARPEAGAEAVLRWQARLLGIGGLLPVQVTGFSPSTTKYLRVLWDFWWREREQFADQVLPVALWRLNGLRPANYPHRRLALAAHWLADGGFAQKLEQWLISEPANRAGALLERLQVVQDGYWSWHWTFRARRSPQPHPMLGAQRCTDYAMNVILPWFWIRAVAGGNDGLQKHVERWYFEWPLGQSNALLRLAEQRLLSEPAARAINTAAAQQGLLQIVRDFCDQSNAVCENCLFPELIKNFRTV